MIFDKKIILASKSPRRQMLLTELGLNFEVKTKDVEEVYPPELPIDEVAVFLAKLKASAFNESDYTGAILLTADTIVCIDNTVIGKPKDREDAIQILKVLSGRKHEVITGVCLKTSQKTNIFSVKTEVYFKKLSNEEIVWYIENYKPFDKAGAYGIQEWIGLVGIERINGSYFNVMGLPVKEVYEALQEF